MRDFNAIDDIEILAMQEKWCMVRTLNLLPTLLFMQSAWRRLWELQADNEADILTYYKPKL